MNDVLTIASGPWRAGINRRGGRLEFLRCDGADLVVPAPAATPSPGFEGAVIAPWPNRLADGRYTFGGRVHHVPVNEEDRRNALHGFTPWEEWQVAGHEADHLGLALDLGRRPGWPADLSLHLDCHLSDGGLRLDLAATNVGTTAAPWGATIHPYLCPPTGTAADWRLTVPASHVLEVTPDRLLPLRLRDVTGSASDLRTPVPVADLDLDHAFTGLVRTDVRTDTGLVRAEVRDRSGAGVHVTWSATSLPWVQVYSGDPRGVAVEPMTCPPDAFNSGVDLVVLGPGDTHHCSWVIGRLDPDD